MAVTDDYQEYVLEQMASAGRVSARRMFGGVGLYLDGLFCALIADDTLYFRTGDSSRRRYEEAGSRPFRPFPDRPWQAMSYWQVPAEVLEDPDQLRAWSLEAREAALAACARGGGRRRRQRRRP